MGHWKIRKATLATGIDLTTSGSDEHQPYLSTTELQYIIKYAVFASMKIKLHKICRKLGTRLDYMHK